MEGKDAKGDIQVVLVQNIRINKHRQRIITFKIDSEVLECWDKALKRLGFTHRSDLIRVAVAEYLRSKGIECARESTG